MGISHLLQVGHFLSSVFVCVCVCMHACTHAGESLEHLVTRIMGRWNPRAGRASHQLAQSCSPASMQDPLYIISSLDLNTFGTSGFPTSRGCSLGVYSLQQSYDLIRVEMHHLLPILTCGTASTTPTAPLMLRSWLLQDLQQWLLIELWPPTHSQVLHTARILCGWAEDQSRPAPDGSSQTCLARHCPH